MWDSFAKHRDVSPQRHPGLSCCTKLPICVSSHILTLQEGEFIEIINIKSTEINLLKKLVL